jgi:HD-GYP domain-containing protein (c-di-GMP phosphodiesterase class II)
MKLLCTKGSIQSQEWNVDEGEISLGRDPLCTVVVDDPKVSRIHCEIRRSDGQHILIDRNSTNGTFVNGVTITRHMLRGGDIILVGNTEFRVVPTDTLDEVRWEDEASPSITLTIPVESMVRKLEEYQSPKPEPVAAQAAPARRDPASTTIRTKLLNHLHIVYELSRTLSRILAIEELYKFLSDTLFGVFADIERICIVVRGDDGGYQPVMMRSREGEWRGEFTLSNAVFDQAIRNNVGILAFDALRDTRFRKFDSVTSFNIRSVMCAPLVTKSEVIGVIYVDNRTRENCFAEEDLELLTSIAAQAATAVQNAKLFENLQRAYHQIILSLINAIEAKDPYTYGHHKRVCEYAIGIGQEMHLPPDSMDRLHRAAELHDIGKIGVQERLIQKPGSLTESEVISFQAHVLTGEKILSPVDYLQDIVPVVRQHHEHFDGKGYPDGLKGDQILPEARILAVADSFDAMTTQRTYNRPVTFRAAFGRCLEKAGTQFDPQMVEALGRYLQNCHADKMQELESEEPPCVP